MNVELFSREVVNHLCGFFERVKGHTGSFTTSAGTFCSTCHERVFNPHYSGSRDDAGDMEIVAALRKKGVHIPKKIQEEITAFQQKVGWKPLWRWK